ncbi:MAG: presenilin family intramembrane aspartyl protease, partial [Candidatus Micrarchaeales archaeon]
MIKVVGNKGIIGIIAIFIGVIAAGMLIEIEAVSTFSVSIMYSTLLNPKFTIISYILDLTLVLILALIVLRRHRHYSNTLLFGMLESNVTGFTSFFVFLMLFAILIPQGVENGGVYMYSVALSIILIMLKNKYPQLRDLTTAVSSVGVGLVLGLNLTFGYALFLLAIVAVYDYIGVFKTREMMSLANAFSSHNSSFLISVSDLEAVPRWGFSSKEVAEYMKYLEETHDINKLKFRKILQNGKLPVVSQISLGEGDLGLPLMVAISAYFTFGNFFMSYAILVGSLLGLFAATYALQRYRKPLPAIPPIF